VPAMLACGHVFCRRYINAMHAHDDTDTPCSNTRSGKGADVKCPQCRMRSRCVGFGFVAIERTVMIEPRCAPCATPELNRRTKEARVMVSYQGNQPQLIFRVTNHNSLSKKGGLI
jgi:hypothetical protein